MARIGFLGAGNMAQGMARRLIGAGHELAVYNRSPDKLKPLVAAGAVAAATPRAAAEGAEAVFAMVADDPASRAVWTGPEGALAAKTAPRAFAVEFSTLSRDWTVALGDMAKAKGLRFIDCPVTGLPAVAAEGKLVLLVGADKADLEAAKPILAPLNAEIIHFGPVGAGTAYKLIVNTMGAVQISAVAEAMLVAEAAGLDLKTVDHALSTGAGASRQVIRVSGMMSRGVHEPYTFSGALRLKDASYGLAMAKKLGVDVKVGQAAVDAFTRQVQVGLGDKNESQVIDALRKKK